MGAKPGVTFSQLLDACLGLPEAQRATFVERLGAEHDAHKPRLRALLARARKPATGGLLQTLPRLEATEPEAHAGAATASPAAGTPAHPHGQGSDIGPYRLVTLLGAGAMGVVWLAARRDGGEPSPVALKLAHVAPRRPDLSLRLEREQRLLRALDHPNIAKLYEAGTTAAGQPYLVLEYVAGEPLDAYCRAHRPDVAQRLALFLQMCAAVAHAHARDIVHRDLKPANVLVAAGASVRLLDFGIGKLLSEALPPELQLTAAAGRPLTPAYASPEQVLGEPVGVASDVYSLGVVLYELLAGTRPYVLDGSGNRALREAIVERMPPPPSRAAVDPELQRVLYGELDGIVLHALRKRPEERFGSVRELADEIASVLARLRA